MGLNASRAIVLNFDFGILFSFSKCTSICTFVPYLRQAQKRYFNNTNINIYFDLYCKSFVIILVYHK